MRTSARRLVFLSGTLTFVICAVFYTKSRQNGLNSQLAAGGSTVVHITWTNSSPSEQEALPVEPACSLRKGVRNDVLLKDQFQFSVPVLQWAGSLSGNTWKELKNRAPPYGWRGLPVDVLGSALLLLNSSHLFDRGSPDRCVRCAVVGNGGILRGSRRGRDIDNHDLVFRMNGAITEGFEEDVGTKISFYGFTTNSMKNALRLYGADGLTRIPQNPDIKYIFIPSDLRDYVMMAAAVHGQTVDSGEDEGDRPAKYFGRKPPETFKMLHPQFISYLTNSFLSSPLMTNIRTRHLYMPSTGALMLLTALHTCDQVSAYGFITRNYAEFSEHYYDSWRRPLKFYSNHDLLMESQLWELLHRRRLLRLLLRRSPQE